ncbi:SRPBCC domain-containing protein [Lacinutrix sp. Hel_I_90]|uniref:SRPBCC family protein n=1 Tax=Lacinutrix sp. Hel_I_90 TaxID=1249999 RepID=UPI0006973502|nr:SRPBCC domain-containing protein [Lacinutrix sp. Hel_I_90]
MVFNNITEFKPKVGFETAFLVSSEERDFTHLWKVTEVMPNKKIAYTWQYKEYSGKSISSFEISEDKNQSTLKITCTGLETFPDTIPEFSRESCEQGWSYFMNRLKGYIENKA